MRELLKLANISSNLQSPHSESLFTHLRINDIQLDAVRGSFIGTATRHYPRCNARCGGNVNGSFIGCIHGRYISAEIRCSVLQQVLQVGCYHEVVLLCC